MKSNIKSVISLTAICAVVSLLLAVTNHFTKPIIEKREAAAVNDALSIVLPGGEEFKSVDITTHKLPETITEVYSEKNGGYVFKMTTTGYASNMVILCGIDKDGKVAGASCISSNETLGTEKEYGNTLKGATAETIADFETISGATMTTGAYRNAIKDALNAVIILKGGSVDLRDEAQILNDNLTAALPQGEGKFTSLFVTEDIGEISAVYSADNKAGYVFVIDEKFVATDASGIVTEESEFKPTVEAAAQKIINSKLEEIDITKYSNMPSQVVKAYKTSTGNFVFDLKAAGFGINGDEWYNPSGKHIEIKVSVTADGKIINTKTIAQYETDKIGSACEDSSFYTQFNGKDITNYGDIDAISGATLTTNGYKTAVSKVFEAIKILKGET